MESYLKDVRLIVGMWLFHSRSFRTKGGVDGCYYQIYKSIYISNTYCLFNNTSIIVCLIKVLERYMPIFPTNICHNKIRKLENPGDFMLKHRKWIETMVVNKLDPSCSALLQ